jgi:hypothetical protein
VEALAEFFKAPGLQVAQVVEQVVMPELTVQQEVHRL